MRADKAIEWLQGYHPDKELMIMWADSGQWEIEAPVWSLACQIFDESSDNYHFNTEVAEMIARAKQELVKQATADEQEGAIDAYLDQLAEERESN